MLLSHEISLLMIIDNNTMSQPINSSGQKELIKCILLPLFYHEKIDIIPNIINPLISVGKWNLIVEL